jgi:hypothetical protein
VMSPTTISKTTGNSEETTGWSRVNKPRAFYLTATASVMR